MKPSKTPPLDLTELEKSKPHVIVELLEYIPDAILIKTVVRKATGTITITSFSAGNELLEKTSPFDIFIQIIDGSAQVEISHKKFILRLGEGVIIPAHAPHCLHADEQFKMISTIIKSGYEE